MNDVRPGEYKNMMIIAEFLSNSYPQYFKLESYEHPVLGVRDSLVMSKYGVTVDVKSLNDMEIDFVGNTIKVLCDQGKFVFNDVITDSTVI